MNWHYTERWIHSTGSFAPSAAALRASLGTYGCTRDLIYVQPTKLHRVIPAIVSYVASGYNRTMWTPAGKERVAVTTNFVYWSASKASCAELRRRLAADTVVHLLHLCQPSLTVNVLDTEFRLLFLLCQAGFYDTSHFSSILPAA